MCLIDHLGTFELLGDSFGDEVGVEQVESSDVLGTSSYCSVRRCLDNIASRDIRG